MRVSVCLCPWCSHTLAHTCSYNVSTADTCQPHACFHVPRGPTVRSVTWLGRVWRRSLLTKYTHARCYGREDRLPPRLTRCFRSPRTPIVEGTGGKKHFAEGQPVFPANEPGLVSMDTGDAVLVHFQRLKTLQRKMTLIHGICHTGRFVL